MSPAIGGGGGASRVTVGMAAVPSGVGVSFSTPEVSEVGEVSEIGLLRPVVGEAVASSAGGDVHPAARIYTTAGIAAQARPRRERCRICFPLVRSISLSPG